MKNFFKNREVPFGIFSYSGSDLCTINKIFRQGLKKRVPNFIFEVGTHSTLCGDST